MNSAPRKEQQPAKNYHVNNWRSTPGYQHGFPQLAVADRSVRSPVNQYLTPVPGRNSRFWNLRTTAADKYDILKDFRNRCKAASSQFLCEDQPSTVPRTNNGVNLFCQNLSIAESVGNGTLPNNQRNEFKIRAPLLMANVLVIDDDRSVCEMVNHALQKVGLQTTSAMNPTDGMKALAAEAPEVVLLDIMLPGTSGLDVFQKIRDFDRKLPVIFITSGTDSATAIKAMQLGGYDYVTKSPGPAVLDRPCGAGDRNSPHDEHACCSDCWRRSQSRRRIVCWPQLSHGRSV
ncbi:MAG: response regulator [Fuerstiella sp.]